MMSRRVWNRRKRIIVPKHFEDVPACALLCFACCYALHGWHNRFNMINWIALKVKFVNLFNL